MRWDCEHCGTLQIADTIENCPVCGTPRPSEDVAAESGAPPAETDESTVEPSDTFPADDAKAPPSHEEDEEPDGQD